jgi:DNA polymerase elongation subunit (family B)
MYTNVLNLGNHILVRGVENGKRYNHRNPYKPTLYIPENRKKTLASGKFHSLDGRALEALKFDGIYDAREFLKKYREIDNFKIYGQTYFQYAYISEFYGKPFKWEPTDVVIGTIDIEVASDNGFPEPSQAFSPITAITLHISNKFHKDTINGHYFVFGCGDYDNKRDDVSYYKCDEEKDIIEAFLSIWEDHYPDIVTGWNIQKFDFPYIINRMNRLFMEDEIPRLSPWRKVSEREVFDGKFGGDEKVQVYEMMGISIIDYLDLYKKPGLNPNANQEAYRLDHIAFVELGEKKLDYTEYGDLYTLYKRNFQKFMDYNIKDVTLVLKINEKLKLLQLVMALAYANKVNFSDVFSQVRMWDAITYNHLRLKNIIVPPKKETVKSEQYVGAYVKDPVPDRYKWVVSVDLDGLYPHLIMMYNLGPETIIDPSKMPGEFYDWFKSQSFSIDSLLEQKHDLLMLKKYNVTVTPNGQLFKRDKQGFLAELMESMYADRKKFKDQMIRAKKKLATAIGDEITTLQNEVSMANNFQAAKKVTLNSAYGAIGNQYFRFFDVRIAEAVTTSGQLAIRWIQTAMNIELNRQCGTDGYDYIIASDTDSMYLNLEILLDKMHPNHKSLSKIEATRLLNIIIERDIQPFIKKTFAELDDYVNSYASKMSMKREAIADVGIWTGKKHYMLNVYDLEGVEYPNGLLKITGLEAVKAGSLSTTARTKLKEAYKIIIERDINAVRDYVEAYRKEFKQFSVEEIALPRGCNGLIKYADAKTIWGFKTPFHVRGALVYNHFLKETNLKGYPAIKEGEKLKYVYLKEPNPLQSNVISFPGILPKEFELAEYIDYDTQFDKVFVDPITTILDAVKWKLEEVGSLDAFWS